MAKARGFTAHFDKIAQRQDRDAERERQRAERKELDELVESLSETRESILSEEKVLSDTESVSKQKIAEIEKYDLVLGVKKKKYENNKAILSKMAIDIENIPAFLAEYKEKLSRETQNILSRLAEVDSNIETDRKRTKKKKSRSR